MTRLRSSSSIHALSLGEKAQEWVTHFAMRVRASRRPDRFAWLIEDLDQYNGYVTRLAGKTLQDCSVLEVGFGARPYRLIALASVAGKAAGIDLDVPLLKGTPAEILRIGRVNGLERAIKSTARFFLFDIAERKALRTAIEQQAGGRFRIDPSIFLSGDASDSRTWNRIGDEPFDLIVSEDVLEHVPSDRLPNLLDNVATRLSPGGIALLRPFIYTGISGNHLPEWYPHLVDSDLQRRSEPWEHLRKDRFQANTYLNRLTLAQMRIMIADRFEILEEVIKFPDLGRQYLNAEVRRDLSQYDDDELFSNSVLFVLRRRKAGART